VCDVSFWLQGVAVLIKYLQAIINDLRLQII
jgi:hypothetical protein